MNWLPAALALCLPTALACESSARELEPRVRRPVALALSPDDRWLYVANRDAGSISVIATGERQVSTEIEVGGRLTDLALWDAGQLLVLDAQSHELVLLGGSGDRWQVVSRVGLPPYPVRLKLDRENGRCFVTSLWSRAVTLLDLTGLAQRSGPELRVVRETRLAFEPREVCLSPDGARLIVADSFAAQVSVFDAAALRPIVSRTFPGHNVRGLAVGSQGQTLLLAQQHLNPLARSTRDDVHWGNMLSNLLVSMPLDAICDPRGEASTNRITRFLGQPGHAAADPGRIHIGPSGETIVLLGGVDEVAVLAAGSPSFRHISVGRRPVAIATAASGQAFVAEMFSDSIGVVDLASAERIGRLELGPPVELTLAERGEALFFDARLSHDGWMSCHSCHSDGHTNGQLNDNLSDGSFEAPKRVLSLLGVGQTGPWAWSGQQQTLEEQVESSIQNTMQGAGRDEAQVAALVAFLETLEVVPPRPPSDEESVEIDRGRQVFHALACDRCHAPPTYTTAQTYDVGLADTAGNKTFNPPSLRGVGRRRTFFHDSRMTALPAVFKKQRHQVPAELPEEDLAALLSFLKSL